MMRKPLTLAAAFAAAFAAGAAFAAPPDWSKVPAKKIVVFYPGVASIQWMTKGTEHSGFRAMRKGENCIGCHEDEAADVGRTIASGEKLEPKPVKGMAGSIPVEVQAAHDGAHLYLRFAWKTPSGPGAPKLDKDNPVKLSVMFEEGGKVEWADLGGCWSACHQDARTMPSAKSEEQTKYVAGGSLGAGKFYDLIQFRSGKGAKPVDGYVAEKRVMEGGKALVSAEGKEAGGAWTVTFTRKLAGGEGDVALAPGKTYNFGFAIHNDHAGGRYHYVSLGYKLGIDAKADIIAAKQ
jgi:hypothetical protein